MLDSENSGPSELEPMLHVRADHPMPPGAYTFYFEVNIVKAGSERCVTTCI
jgi:hypothetical protein